MEVEDGEGKSFASHQDPTTEHVRATVALISQIEDLMKKHMDTMPDPQVKARTELLFGLVHDLEHIDQETAAAAWAWQFKTVVSLRAFLLGKASGSSGGSSIAAC